MTARAALAASVGLAAAAAACATSGWPDEAGAPVAASQVQIIHAGEGFMASLATRRRGRGGAEPLVTPRLQRSLKRITDLVSAGKLSAPRARAAGETWGRAAYHRDVDVWILDCALGARMAVPAALVEQPRPVLTYSIAIFRPLSMAAEQCAVLVVSVKGADAVGTELPSRALLGK